MRKSMILTLATAFVTFGTYAAGAFDFAPNPGVQINSVISLTPAITSGAGEFYPIVNHLQVREGLW